MRIVNRSAARCAWLGAAAAVALAGAPAAAETVVLDFNTGTPACTAVSGGPAGQTCTTNGQFIGANYGSTSHLTVSYDPSEPDNQPPRASLQFATDGYFRPASGLAYAFPGGPASELSRIIFTPAAGYEVSLASFSWDKLTATTSADFIFEVRDAANALLFSRGNAVTSYTVNTAYYTTPLTFLFGNGGRGLAGVDDVTVNLRPAAVTPGAVPEPASWALMIGGFGAVGGLLRRRRGRGALATA